MPQKLQELQISVFPPKIQIWIFRTQKAQFQHLFQFLEFWHKAKLLESGHATNKSCPDRSPLPPVESISPNFDFDNSKIFWGSLKNVKSQKKRVTVRPPTIPPTLDLLCVSCKSKHFSKTFQKVFFKGPPFGFYIVKSAKIETPGT